MLLEETTVKDQQESNMHYIRWLEINKFQRIIIW